MSKKKKSIAIIVVAILVIGMIVPSFSYLFYALR